MNTENTLKGKERNSKLYQMKKLIFTIAFLFLAFQTTMAQSPNWQWATGTGGTGFDRGESIAVDGNGNSYIAGWFGSSSIKFGNTTLTRIGGVDIFIVKYDASGNLLWARNAGGTGDDYVYSIAIDVNGNSFITGEFNSLAITFGGITVTNKGGKTDAFLAKYDNAGNPAWAKSAGGSNYDGGSSVTTDASGNAYWSGYFFSPSITFGTSTFTNANNSGFNTDVFIIKYNSSGNLIWAKQIGGTGGEEAPSIIADAKGNFYMTGSFFSSTVSFGNITLTNTVSAGNSDEVFIAKFDSSGNAIWAKSAGGTYNDNATSIAFDASGNSFVTGIYQSPSNKFGNTTLINNDSTLYGIHSFIIKNDSSGNVLWAKKGEGGVDGDVGTGISVDAAGNSYIIGYFQSPSLTIGSATVNNYDNLGNSDIYIIKLGPSGNVLWAKSMGGSDFDYGWGIATDINGNAYITGLYDSPVIAFGGINLTNASGSDDVLIAKLSNVSGMNEEGKIFSSIKIFPNPGNGEINILSSGEILEIEITNILGQIVYQAKPNEKEISLQLNNGGIYFITITESKQKITKKIIVQ